MFLISDKRGFLLSHEGAFSSFGLVVSSADCQESKAWELKVLQRRFSCKSPSPSTSRGNKYLLDHIPRRISQRNKIKSNHLLGGTDPFSLSGSTISWKKCERCSRCQPSVPRPRRPPRGERRKCLFRPDTSFLFPPTLTFLWKNGKGTNSRFWTTKKPAVEVEMSFWVTRWLLFSSES